MRFSDEQIREILELQQKISEKIKQHKDEIELLEKNLSVLNSIIKQSSFTKASMLELTRKNESVIPITKSGDGTLIANAYVTPDQVSIVLEQDVGLNEETPPFKSFFLDRIIGEMKKKDSVDADRGVIQKDSVIDCVINKNGTILREIIVKNYRQKERVNEIINTAAWSLSKMIDNLSK
jgi:hypothetical protein